MAEELVISYISVGNLKAVEKSQMMSIRFFRRFLHVEDMEGPLEAWWTPAEILQISPGQGRIGNESMTSEFH